MTSKVHAPEFVPLDQDGGLRNLNALWEAVNQHAIVSMADPAGNIIFANDTFVRISGYSREELLGQNHRLLKSGVHDDAFWESMWKTITSGYVWKGVVCNRAKDGSHYWVEAQISPFFGPHGEIEKYISIRTDITAHKQAIDELALTQSLKSTTAALESRSLYLRATLDNLPFQFWLKDAGGRYLAVNQVFADACGVFSPDAVVGQTDQDLWPTLAAEKFRQIDIEVQASGRAQTREEFDATQARWLEVFIKPLAAAGGEVLGTVGYSRDISARKSLQQQLEQHNQHLDAIFALSPDGFVTFDAHRCVSHMSPAFTRMTGIDLAQARGLPAPAFALLLGHKCTADSRVDDLDKLRTGHRLEMAQGERRILDVVLRLSATSNVSQILYFRDVTRETEVDRLKSEFLNAAAHELRTPMTTIFGYSEMLLHDEIDRTSQREVAAVVHQQSELMVSILDDMLDLVRMERRGARDMVWDHVHLRALLATLVTQYKLAPGRSAPVLSLPATALTVWGDATKIRQAVRNVLSNAYKYSPVGSEVHCSVLQACGPGALPMVGIRISDSGIGMTPAQQARVFERFYRADPSGKALGTGLGLSLVKEIVNLHRGRVELQSAPDAGTTVTLWLPSQPLQEPS